MVRERSQGTARWMQSIRAALDEVTRIILMPLEQQKLFPRLPGEGRVWAEPGIAEKLNV